MAILGIINKRETIIDENLLKKALKAITYLPANKTEYLLENNVAIANSQLMIYTQQNHDGPLIKSDHLIITADARIYNRKSLSTSLNISNDQLEEISDSKLILLAYIKWGEGCLEHLEGEFAFAIWDKREEKLFAATDHIGTRPLFYYDSPDTFIFCSQIKGIEAAKCTPNYFNEDSLIEYFYRQGHPDQTYNKEIFALCGGNHLILRNKQVKIQKYWELKPLGKYHFKDDKSWYECYYETLYQAVEKRLPIDGPVGITLSGGLDSTSIACILSDILSKKNKPLYAFSLALPTDYTGIEKDERRYIDIVGKHCPNIIQTYIDTTQFEPFGHTEEGFNSEERFPNPFIHMDLSIVKSAQSKGVKKLFNGFGGDYWASWKGNTVIYLLMNKGKYKEAFTLLKELKDNDHESWLYELRYRYLCFTSIYKALRTLKPSKGEINWQIKTPLRDDLLKRYPISYNLELPYDRTKHMMGQTNKGVLSRKLTYFYNRHYTYGIECGTPMFDKDLFEFLADVPISLFLKGGYKRALIRNAMKKHIPSEISKRMDKIPYVPGYDTKILNSKDVIEKFMLSSDCNFIFDKYIDKNVISSHFNDITPIEGFGRGEDIVGLRISQAGIVYQSLKHLNGYVFE